MNFLAFYFFTFTKSEKSYGHPAKKCVIKSRVINPRLSFIEFNLCYLTLQYGKKITAIKHEQRNPLASAY
jgi:hypothetical protein